MAQWPPPKYAPAGNSPKSHFQINLCMPLLRHISMYFDVSHSRIIIVITHINNKHSYFVLKRAN